MNVFVFVTQIKRTKKVKMTVKAKQSLQGHHWFLKDGTQPLPLSGDYTLDKAYPRTTETSNSDIKKRLQGSSHDLVQETVVNV